MGYQQFLRLSLDNRYIRAGGLLMTLVIPFFVFPLFAFAAPISDWTFTWDNHSDGQLADPTFDGWNLGSGDLFFVDSGVLKATKTPVNNMVQTGLSDLTSHSIVTYVFDVKYDSGSNRDDTVAILTFQDSGSPFCDFGLSDYGTSNMVIGVGTNSGVTSLSAPVSAGTWYQVFAYIDIANGRCKVSVPSIGFESSYVSPVSSFSSLTSLEVKLSNDNNTHYTWIDDMLAFDSEITEVPLYEYPSQDQDYIVLVEPQIFSGHANVSYGADFYGRLNLPNASAGTKSYRVSFLSQTGEDYSSLTVTGTTTSYDEYDFSGSVQFSQDDIVYVRAYLYDCASPGSCLPSYISSEYVWWVSANGNPTETVDLGVFRTGTSTCGFSATDDLSFAQGFAWGFCQAVRVLFVPSEASISYFSSRAAIATGTAPFSYIYDGSHYFNDLTTYSTSSWALTMPTSTAYVGGITFFSSDQVENSFAYNSVYTMLAVVTYILIPFYVWRRRDALLKR